MLTMILFAGCESSEELRSNFKNNFIDNCQYGADYAEYSDLMCECNAEFQLAVLKDDEIRLIRRGFHPGESEEAFRLYGKMKDIEFQQSTKEFQDAIKQCMHKKADKREKK